MTPQFAIYLAGPISGCKHAETVGWRDQFTQLMAKSVLCLSPMRGKDHLKLLDHIEGSYSDSVCSCQQAIMSRDYFDCHRADIVVANLLSSALPPSKRASLGTAMELAWCYAQHKPVIAIVDQPGEEPNQYDHPMINEAIKFRVHSVQEAVELAKMVLCV